MEPELLRIVEQRLEATGDQDEPWAMLVLAACEGRNSLEAVLGGGTGRRAGRRKRFTAPEPDGQLELEQEPRGAYLRSITVEGFRGVGAARTLELRPEPGLTLVVGRNGSGKSSFAEGLEILLTGANWRWQYRSAIWKEGWRNLHQPDAARVAADLAIEGERSWTTVTRVWPTGARLDGSQVEVRLPSKGSTSLSALGWSDAMEAYRPFLSYNELGSMFDEGPTKLHDRLARILGLGELDQTVELLRAARLERERLMTDATKTLAPLLATLADIDDPRARQAAEALTGRRWNLDVAAAAVGLGTDAGDAAGHVLGVLRGLSSIETPTTEDARAAADRLREAAGALDAIKGTDAGRAGEVAGLLRDALAYHAQHSEEACPVCGSERALSSKWRSRAEQRITDLERQAATWTEARTLGTTAVRGAERLLVHPPTILGSAASAGVDVSGLVAAWDALRTVPDASDLIGLADHLDARVGPLGAEAATVRLAARAELDRREDLWRPVSLRLAAWLRGAQEAADAATSVPALKSAEAWLKGASADVRRLRFEPIADAAIENWRELRQQSSVELSRIALEGSGVGRRVSLEVAIDGVEGAALGVMSQGELNAIALGLFLPRATLPESPFRFVVIDDPVQSMDPARVDGLARVLARTARTRQVVVFTHDDRLPESTRRLGIDAWVIEVTRHEDSVVELRRSSDPVRRNLDDARAMAKAKGLPIEIMHDLVPSFCRSAIEAAAIEVVRRRRIGRGEVHAAVERLLEDAKTTNVLMSLALWDDPDRGGEVGQAVSKRFGPASADALGTAIRGAHAGFLGDLETLIHDTERLCGYLGQLK